MPILKWLFKGGQEQAKEPITRASNKQTASSTVQKPDCKDLVLYKRGDSIYQRSTRNEESEMERENNSDSTARVLMDRHNPKTCFYSTLNLKKLGRFGNSNHSWLRRVMKEEEAAHVNNKGLSISSNATTVPTLANEQCGSMEKKDKPKADKTKPISRMKELLRWAASSKAEKGGGKYTSRKTLGYPNRGAIKAAAHDDESSLSSSKIDYRWDVGNCSTSSSAKINSRWDAGSCSTSSSAQINSRWDVGNCSTSSSAFSGFSSYTSSSARSDQSQIKPIISSVAEDASAPDSDEKEATTSSQEPERCSSRRGNWITNDDLFVVLEL